MKIEEFKEDEIRLINNVLMYAGYPMLAHKIVKALERSTICNVTKLPCSKCQPCCGSQK